MEIDFNVIISLLRYLIILTYGFICFVSIIFTFFIEKYRWLNELLEYEIIVSRAVTIIESSTVDIDDWLFTHHRIVGPILFFGSAFNVFMLSNTIQGL